MDTDYMDKYPEGCVAEDADDPRILWVKTYASDDDGWTTVPIPPGVIARIAAMLGLERKDNGGD